MELAVQHHNAGRLFEAEGIYQQIMQADPSQPIALHLLGVIAHQRGNNDVAVDFITKALAIKPDYAKAHNDLGAALDGLGRLDEAVVSYHKALAISPDYTEAHYNLGNALKGLARLDEAVASYHKALAIKPDYVEAHNNLANALRDLGKLDEAVASYDKALAIKPDHAEIHNNLGIALKGLARLDEAVASYHKALAIKPDYAEAHNNLANALRDLGKLDKAVSSYRKALNIKPDYAEALSNYGVALMDQGKLDEAVVCHHRALAIKPDFAEAHSNLGNALQKLVKLDEAAANYHKALAIKPDYVEAHSNLLFCLNYHPAMPAEAVFEEYQAWNVRHARPLFGPLEHANDRDVNRRLRVGYVSPDFRRHSARYFIEPLLARHDKAVVELFAYAELVRQDEISDRLRGLVDHWCNTVGLSDEALAARIRADGIDILIDLAGHTKGNRLLVFARKPAPVQVSWMGYAYTTGLETIDYFMSDNALTPEGCEHLFSETLVRLPVGVVYRPPKGLEPAGPLPAQQNGYVTFGSLSRSVRINHRVVKTWAAILGRVPGSRLIINSGNFKFPELQQQYIEQFGTLGVAPERLAIGYDSPPWDIIRRIDIELDCFPHNSGTTLFESLYMGVPFVTLKDRPSVGRMGAMILTGLGHGEWIAETETEYIDKAAAMAEDLPRLGKLHANLRQEMERSRLMDESGFARAYEAALRTMWTAWCEETRR